MKLLNLPVAPKQFIKDMVNELNEDNVFNGAAALAYYLTLAIFPALIFLLSVVPFLPIENLDVAVMDFIRKALPDDSARMLTETVREITLNRKEGLLSIGALGTFWAATAGTVAVIDHLNRTYDVPEKRSFIKIRLIAFGLTLLLGVCLLGALLLTMLGGKIQTYMEGFGFKELTIAAFAVGHWVVVVGAVLLMFSVVFYFGPNVKQKWRWITPGSVFGTFVWVAVTIGFRFYISNFANYGATYGSIGAVVVMMLWLYVTGLVFLIGSEINSLLDKYEGIPHTAQPQIKRLA